MQGKGLPISSVKHAPQHELIVVVTIEMVARMLTITLTTKYKSNNDARCQCIYIYVYIYMVMYTYAFFMSTHKW